MLSPASGRSKFRLNRLGHCLGNEKQEVVPNGRQPCPRLHHILNLHPAPIIYLRKFRRSAGT